MIMLDELFEVMQEEAGRVFSLDRKETLFHREDAVREMYLLRSGVVDLVRYQRDGTKLVLHHLSGPAIIAEASMYAARYHCDCICVEPAEVFAVPRRKIEALLRRSPQLFEKWAAYLAIELQNTRHRNELLGRKTVAERLSGWVDWNGGLPPKGSWKQVADQIGVTPEALYRELAKRKAV